MSTLFSHFFQKINQISPLEADFTEVLESIALTPKTLYFYGKIPQNVVKSGKSTRPKTVAIVGSRHNTRYGEEVAYKLAYELAKHGVIIISGLAYGIDSIGHKGCLDAGGTTIAVLGTRIDDIYPREHLGLATKILEAGGAIFSEYSPLLQPDAPLGPAEAGFRDGEWLSYEKESQGLCEPPYEKRRLDQRLSFLYRNRIISGLADIVVVIEAAERSGTLSTATHALEQGKTVYAVPGNITSPYSIGCNKLIKQGAIPYTAPSDILDDLFPEEAVATHRRSRRLNLIGDNEIETKIIKAIAAGHQSGDDIMKITSLPPEVFSQAVTMLEIKSRIRALGMNNWSLT